jgi:hypothetical protein
VFDRLPATNSSNSSMLRTVPQAASWPENEIVLSVGDGGIAIFSPFVMSLQEAVEAPRIWTQGDGLEVEDGYCTDVREKLAALGHPVLTLSHIGAAG